ALLSSRSRGLMPVVSNHTKTADRGIRIEKFAAKKAPHRLQWQSSNRHLAGPLAPGQLAHLTADSGLMEQHEQVPRVLQRLTDDSSAAAAELLPLVYDELRRLAQSHLRRQSSGHTLQATALVHEAYLRLVGGGESRWESRAHFFAVAA